MSTEMQIALPHDYDARFGVQGLNAEIENLIRQIAAAHEEAAIVLHEINSDLQQTNEVLKRRLATECEQREEAEMKRDNAVRMMEEAQTEVEATSAEIGRMLREVESLNGQIRELEAELRRYKSAAKERDRNIIPGGIKLTSTLPPESEEEKRERSRLDIINKGLSRLGMEPLNLPPLPSTVTETDLAEQSRRVQEAAEADAESFRVVSDDSAEIEVERGEDAVSGDARDVNTPKNQTEIELLMTRMDDMEAWRKRIDAHLFPHRFSER